MPTTSSVYCPNCNRFMRNQKSGVIVEEKMEGNRPYKLWSADLYACAECGNRVITKFAGEPIAEHFEESFELQRFNLYECAPAEFFSENL